MKWHNKTENQPNIRCQLCLTEFSDEADFKAHTELHANLSPLQCIECKRTFLQKNNLVKHMQFHVSLIRLSILQLKSFIHFFKMSV